MKALTVKQPWASLIALGLKDVENRTWKTNYRGRILIHAGMTAAEGGWKALNKAQIESTVNMKGRLFDDNGRMPKGAIIGSVEIVDCVQNYPSIWAEQGVWNWVLKNPVMFDEPITGVKGKLSLWEYEGEIPEQKPKEEPVEKEPAPTLVEMQEKVFHERVVAGVKDMIDNLTVNEQMRVSIVPLIIEQIAWIYAERAMALAAKDKISILKKLTRTLKAVRQKWNDELRKDLDYSHLKSIDGQVELCMNTHLAKDLMILYWTVNREFKRVAPQYPFNEMRTYAIISTLFVDLLGKYNLKIDALLAEKLKNKDLEPSVIPPIITELRRGMVAFSGVEGKFNYDNSDVKLGMDIIGSKIERIDFCLPG